MDIDRSGRLSRYFIVDLWPLILAGVLFWAVLPGLTFGNLHTDTLEAAYWARSFALGYTKHPPLASWVLDAVLWPGPWSILGILLASQVLSIFSAFFVWRLVHDRASRSTAAFSAALLLISPVSTFYAIQINHNSILIPFCAATLLFGLHLLEKRRMSDAIGLGLAVGLGAITKYEIIFTVVPLLVLSLSVPSFRLIWKSKAAYLSVLVATLIFLPHLLWLQSHGWSSMVRAVDSAPVEGIASILSSLWGLIWGGVAIFLAPLLLLRLTRDHRKGGLDQEALRPDTQWIGKVLFFAPLAAVILASIITGQFIKALWLLPLAPSTVMGLALLFPAGSNTEGLLPKANARTAVLTSLGILVLYWAYLFVGEMIDRPMESYLANTQPLSKAVSSFWAQHSKERLACVVTDESKVGTAPVLWLTSRPDIVDITAEGWPTPERVAKCAATGAVAVVLDGGIPIVSKFPKACMANAVPIRVNTIFGIAPSGWPGSLVYIPPDSAPADSMRDCGGG
jgi:4-amino-4-deoxy-L-arabinose transferase-like glycosyltransferase